jgi:hypothetical protein
MNLRLNSSFPAICFSILFFTSCQSHEQKADDAFEQVKQEKYKHEPAPVAVQEVIEASKKTEPEKIEPDKKNEYQDEWSKFKSEIEKKIILNEIKIKEIKAMPDANSKLLKKVMRLEEDNNALRKDMNDYNEEAKTKWETFKATINHNVNEIDIELKDFTKNKKK